MLRNGWSACVILIEAIEMLGMWPLQTRKLMLKLIDKPKGGLREVTLFPSFYCVWARARRETTQQWRDMNDRTFLSFGARKSPEQAVWRQSVKLEAAASRGAHAASTLYDLRKYFEKTPLEEVRRRAKILNAPKVIVKCMLAMFYSPRFLQRGKILHNGRYCARRGVPAGCILADFAIVIFAIPSYDLFCERVPQGVSLFTWFDDLVLEGFSDEGEEVLVKNMSCAVTLLVAIVREDMMAELALDKVGTMATNKSIIQSLKKKLGPLIADDEVPPANLGIDH